MGTENGAQDILGQLKKDLDELNEKFGRSDSYFTGQRDFTCLVCGRKQTSSIYEKIEGRRYVIVSRKITEVGRFTDLEYTQFDVVFLADCYCIGEQKLTLCKDHVNVHSLLKILKEREGGKRPSYRSMIA